MTRIVHPSGKAEVIECSIFELIASFRNVGWKLDMQLTDNAGLLYVVLWSGPIGIAFIQLR